MPTSRLVQLPQVEVVGPGLTLIPRPPTELPAGAVDPGNGDPSIYNPGTYMICDAADDCATYGPGWLADSLGWIQQESRKQRP